MYHLCETCLSHPFGAKVHRNSLSWFTIAMNLLSIVIIFTLLFFAVLVWCFQSTMEEPLWWHTKQKQKWIEETARSMHEQINVKWRNTPNKFAQVRAFPVNWVQSIDCFFAASVYKARREQTPQRAQRAQINGEKEGIRVWHHHNVIN